MRCRSNDPVRFIWIDRVRAVKLKSILIQILVNGRILSLKKPIPINWSSPVNTEVKLVVMGGFEPPTCGLLVHRSNQLSYITNVLCGPGSRAGRRLSGCAGQVSSYRGTVGEPLGPIAAKAAPTGGSIKKSLINIEVVAQNDLARIVFADFLEDRFFRRAPEKNVVQH